MVVIHIIAKNMFICETQFKTNEMKVSVLLLVVTLPFSLCCVIKVVQVVLIANHLQHHHLD